MRVQETINEIPRRVLEIFSKLNAKEEGFCHRCGEV
jgi:hypothetical protein